MPKSFKEEKDLSLQQQLQLISKTSLSFPLPGIIEQFWQETQLTQGSAVNDYLIPFSKKVTGLDLADLISLEELWELCYNLFQAWYQGKKGYLLPDEETVLEPNKIQDTLSTLSQNYDLGIATGRPRQEVIEPLTKLGILKYFNSQRIVTYDEVLEAQKSLQNTLKLGKPHPFIIYKAVYPQLDLQEILQPDFTLENPEKVAYIGDAGSDVVAAKTAKCLSIGVLTGFSTAESLLNLGCDMIVQDITHLKNLGLETFSPVSP